MSKSNVNRRLSAVLVSDVVGYSRLMGENEEGTLDRVRLLNEEVMHPNIAEHGGRIVKLLGDGLLAEFPSAVDAVKCALDVQRSIAVREPGCPESERIRLRIGINVGDIILEDGDIFGDGVNVAARLESLAEAGGICISGSVKSAVGKNIDIGYEYLGEQQVKNIELPVQVYRLIAQGESSPSSPGRATAAPALPEKPSIAVLAFNNMSGDPEQEYFSDGITEDIITELSRFSELFVISRNSSFAYKGQAVDIKSVAAELGVRYMLEGSVRRSGKRIRINAQLLDCTLDSHIWAERYDGEMEDIFDLQDEITLSIVGSIAPQIEIAEVEKIRQAPASNLTSYELSLKAQAIFYDAARIGSPELRQESIDAAQVALDIDPRNTHALWIQGYSYTMQYLYRWGEDPEESLVRAEDIASRFLAVDSNNSRAYLLRAMASTFRGEYDSALADCRRAFEINPNFAVNAMVMAWGESLAGLTTEAKEHAHLALRMSPRDLDLWLGDAYLALLQASFADGDFAEAQRWGLLAIQMTPKAPIRRALMAATYAHMDDMDSAAQHLRELEKFSPDFAESILSERMSLYKLPEHNQLLIEGLQKAGAGQRRD